MTELRLSEYVEGRYLWLPQGARVLAVRQTPEVVGTYTWTVLEDTFPTEKTLRRFLIAEINDVCRVSGNERLEYIGAIGTGEDARTVFEIVRPLEANPARSVLSYCQT